jgi:hypothetical protein
MLFESLCKSIDRCRPTACGAPHTFACNEFITGWNGRSCERYSVSSNGTEYACSNLNERMTDCVSPDVYRPLQCDGELHSLVRRRACSDEDRTSWYGRHVSIDVLLRDLVRGLMLFDLMLFVLFKRAVTSAVLYRQSVNRASNRRSTRTTTNSRCRIFISSIVNSKKTHVVV